LAHKVLQLETNTSNGHYDNKINATSVYAQTQFSNSSSSEWPRKIISVIAAFNLAPIALIKLPATVFA